MNNTLKDLRTVTLLSCKQLSELLDVSVHTYKAMENGTFSISPEIICMLSKIYQLPLVCFENYAVESETVLSSLRERFGCLDVDERYELALHNLVGNCNKKQIRKKIRNIKKEFYRKE